MYLSKITLNRFSKEARRDISDPYQLHSTLCQAFSYDFDNLESPENSFLWRLEYNDLSNAPSILIQSRCFPDWSKINYQDWLEMKNDPLNLEETLKLNSLKPGKKFRFRIRAYPSISQNSNKERIGLLRYEDQLNWWKHKSQKNGFEMITFPVENKDLELCSVAISQARMLYGIKRKTNNDPKTVALYSVQFDGILKVVDPQLFRHSLDNGIGHGKSMGLGLLTVAPIP